MATITPRVKDPETFAYGEHELQKVHVYDVVHGLAAANPSRGYWVVYVHGGAWRDPTVLANSFRFSESLLQGDPLIQKHVVGFASVDYRLSPHPDFPQDPASTPLTQLRNAKHPDHLHDVQAALIFLQRKYEFGDRYILVGHSCGATLAFQIVMNDVPGTDPIVIPKPRAIAGVCGIYDLRLLRDDFKQYPSVEQFIKGAFGNDEDTWDRDSPARVTGPDGVTAGWTHGQVATVASSLGDSLINASQALAMEDILMKWQEPRTRGLSNRSLIILQHLREEHDDVWAKGEELARVIIRTVESLTSLDIQ